MKVAFRLTTEWQEFVHSKHPVTDSYYFSLDSALEHEAAIKRTNMAKSTKIEPIRIEQ